jgi:hypothetical protein
VNVENLVLKKWNELFEKYELESIPKTSWKDLCMLEMKRYAIPPDITPEKANPEGKM